MSKTNEIHEQLATFIRNSGMIGEDGILNECYYPLRSEFTHESWSASPRYTREGWYRRELDGGNPNCMAYGFAINELTFLFRDTGDESYLARAKRLADYIIGYQITDRSRRTFGGFGTGELLNDSAHQLPMSLLNLHVCCGEPRYRDAALLCLDHFVLRHHCQRDSRGELTGVFYDHFDESKNRFDNWGEPGRCAHSPLCFAFSLFAAYDLTGNREYLDAVRLSYDWLLREYEGQCLARYNGIAISPEDPPRKVQFLAEQTVPRYVGYIIHTLLGVSLYTKDLSYLAEAERCADMILPAQREDGTFPLCAELEKFYPRTQNGAYGYLGGPLYLLYCATGKKAYLDSATRAVEALALDQIHNKELRQCGGIVRRGGASVLEGMVTPFGYGFVTDVFQTLLNMQGVNMLLGKQSYIGMVNEDKFPRLPRMSGSTCKK